MNFLLCVLVPLLLQLAVTAGVILATNGTGSFVGLGAMLLALYGIPVTAIANFIAMRRQPKVGRSLLRALPVMSLTLLGLAGALAFDL